MCGIVGYVGSRPCKELLLQGLERLEYRGYDSAGICLMNGQVDIVRRVGKVSVLRDAVGPDSHPATMGLAHTRWATHGGVIEANAHPIEACEGSGVTVVHNGIIENYATLRRELSDAGHEYHSDTDSEVIAHLVEDSYAGDLVEAVRAAYARLDGHFAFAVAHRDSPEILVAARRGCPLVVVRHGTRAGLLNVAGTQLGLAVMIGIVGIGLTSLIEAMGHWFDWLRLAGAAYLVWLGWKMIRSSSEAQRRGAARRRAAAS